MKQQELTLYQVIEILSQIENKDKVFSRVGDEDFKLVRGHFGDILMKIGNESRVFPLFNYINDRWVLDNE